MIEVEKKFLISSEQEARLILGTDFIGEKTFTDEYFDYLDYRLTTKDTWLRKRGENFELKAPLNIGKDRMADQYREIEDEAGIVEYLNFDNTKTLQGNMESEGIVSFCKIVTTRRKYKKEGFVIDIDSMDFGYNICEIEKMVDNEDQIKDAIESILVFSAKFNLNVSRVRGKVLEYLRINNPSHMEAIEEAIGKPQNEISI